MKPAFKNLSSSIRTFQAELSAADDKRRKAAQTAVRVEGFRLKKVLAAEIRAGSPGGAKFKALSVIAKKLGRGAESRTPLKRLASVVRYWVEQTASRYSVSVGYQDRPVVNSAGGVSRNNQLSRSWLGIVRSNIEGGSFDPGKFDRNVNPYTRSDRTTILISAFGGSRGRKKLLPGRSQLLLRKSTSRLRIPARPIIDPFWSKHQREAMAQIERNFMAKMAGQRI